MKFRRSKLHFYVGGFVKFYFIYHFQKLIRLINASQI